jgi:hypothetical protein
MAPDRGKPQRSQDDLIDWFTVSYRTIYIVVAVVLAIAGAVGYNFYKKNQAPPTPPPEAAPASVPSAVFTAIEGSVQVRAAGTLQWVGADSTTILNKSDLVRTGAGASAEIKFFDGTVFHMRPDSLITIEESMQDPTSKRKQVAAKIQSGSVNFSTTASSVPGSSTTISTPVFKTTPTGDTAGAISVAEGGDSGIKLFKGTARAETSTGQKVEIAANEGVSVDSSGKAGPKIVLPSVPTLLAPAPDAEITYPDPSRATTLLIWKPVEKAGSYHVVLDYSANFTRPIVDRKDWKANQMELQGLDVGKYYWRVATLDKEGTEGSYSDFYRFSVLRPGTGTAATAAPPPLVIESLEPRGNILQVKGHTEPGASLTVNGQRVDVQTDGTFNEFITLDKPGKQLVVIRATGINGGVSEQKRPVVVSY